MNIISTLKALPLIGILSMGLVLSPTAVVAEKGDHAYSNKGHNSTFRSSKHRDRHAKHSYRHDGHKFKSHNKHYRKHHGKHVYNNRHVKNHGYSPRRYYNYNNNYAHNHGYRHGRRGHHDVFDNIEFMFGLHTGNFDIIFRD